MDVDRLLNMHRAQEIMELATTGKFKDYEPAVSVKFDTAILDLDLSLLDLPQYDEAIVEIENKDTVQTVLDVIRDGYRPLVLNMANHRTPGGGFLSGAIAQEEHLFRCTNYFRTLTEGLYPMASDEVIYSPKVHIMKDENYTDLLEPVAAGFIAVAAIQRPSVTRQGGLCPRAYELTKRKVEMIYQTGAIGKYDCLVLGALGCGAFYNPPRSIARIFAEVTAEYADRFKKIVFAIKCDEDNHNCDIFQRTFLRAFQSDAELETEPSESDSDGDPYTVQMRDLTQIRHHLPQHHTSSTLCSDDSQILPEDFFDLL